MERTVGPPPPLSRPKDQGDNGPSSNGNRPLCGLPVAIEGGKPCRLYEGHPPNVCRHTVAEGDSSLFDEWTGDPRHEQNEVFQEIVQ